jgi:nitrite reductase/ring-hydroxylating ferredoxin subunit/uncharacterized membrane protein
MQLVPVRRTGGVLRLRRMIAQQLAKAIENATVLDGPAEAVAGLVSSTLKPGSFKDLLSGTPIGHPAHPALVVLPIGSWVGASWLDLAGGRGSRDAARKLVALGVVSALPTALTGASDWSDTSGAARRVGFVHALSNSAGLVLYVASWRARRHGKQAKGAGLALAGAGVLGISGWLGGHLAYALGVGVDNTAFVQAPEGWTDVAADATLLEGHPISASLGDSPVMLVRRAGEIYALNDRCTHRGGPLHEGPLIEDCIECPWHGSRFRLSDGSVVRGPATTPEPSYDVRVQAGRVLIRRTAEERSLRKDPVASVGNP